MLWVEEKWFDNSHNAYEARYSTSEEKKHKLMKENIVSSAYLFQNSLHHKQSTCQHPSNSQKTSTQWEPNTPRKKHSVPHKYINDV